MRKCTGCGEEKPATAEFFRPRSERAGALNTRCKACVTAQNRERKVAGGWVPPEVLPAGMKRCRMCREVFPATREFFGREPNTASGLRGRCHDCVKAASAEERARPERKAYMREYTQQHKERLLEQARARREADPEKYRAYRQQRYQEHRGVLLAEMAARYAANPTPVKLRTRAWRADNPERRRDAAARARRERPEVHRASNTRRKARKRAAPGTHTAQDIRDLLARQGGLCAYCAEPHGEDYHVDHRVPLSRGGSNGPENLCIACAPCNLSKNDKTPEEFAAYRASLAG